MLLYARQKDMLNKYKCDYCNVTSGLQGLWAGGAIAGGSFGSLAGTALHPGVIKLTSTTAANSGYKLMSDVNCIMLAGGERTTFVFKMGGTLPDVTRRLGFHNATDHNAPTDGVYCKIASGVLTGQTANNGTAEAESATATDFTVVADTWYRLRIQLNTDASLATFTLFADNSNTVLWTDTLAANIPTTRTVGHGGVCTYLTASAITMGYLDYVDATFPGARKTV